MILKDLLGEKNIQTRAFNKSFENMQQRTYLGFQAA